MEDYYPEYDEDTYGDQYGLEDTIDQNEEIVQHVEGLYIHEGESSEDEIDNDSFITNDFNYTCSIIEHNAKMELDVVNKINELDQNIYKLEPLPPNIGILKVLPIDILNNIVSQINNPVDLLRFEWTINPLYRNHFNSCQLMCDFDHKKSDVIPLSYPTLKKELIECFHCNFIRLPAQHHQNMKIILNYNTPSYIINSLSYECKLAGGIDMSRVRISYSDETKEYIDVREMVNLRFLSSTSFHVIGLNNCQSLISLELCNTETKSIHGLKNLKYLKCSGHNLESIYDLENLETLSITGTSIKNIDSLQTITKLKLTSTRIEKLDRMNKLRELHLSYNNLDNLNSFVDIEYLFIKMDNGEFSDPLQFYDLINLKHLQIESFEEFILDEEYKNILQKNNCFIDISINY